MTTGSSAEMPFLDHLEELRWRIIWALAALVVGIGVGFFVVLKFDLLVWMQGPILPYLHGRRLSNMQVAGGFSIMMQTSIILGIIVALPVIIYQVWAFLSPALHKHEKKLAIPVIVGAVALFVAGAALAWFFVVPMTLKFLTGMGENAFDQVISATDYFGFVSTLVLLMGAVFELPILVLILSVIGLVTPQLLSKFRKHAVIGSYLVAAIITPGDALTATVGLVVPIYLLFEASIGVSWIVLRMKQRKRIADEAAEAAEAAEV